MHVAGLLLGFMLPLLALSQTTGNQNQNQSSIPNSPSGTPAPTGNNTATPQVTLSTFITTGVSLGPSRSLVSFTSTIVSTITLPPATPTGNTSTSNGNGTTGGNSTTSSTPTGPLPTAPTDINGGGNGPGGAPSPGASSAQGIFGPNDSFTNWALGLHIDKALLVITGAAVGGTLVLM